MGRISALETTRENIVPQPLSLASKVPWACPSEFLIHWSCQLLGVYPTKEKDEDPPFPLGWGNWAFIWVKLKSLVENRFLFASTVAGLELVTNVFCEVSKEPVKANLQSTAALLPASPGPRPPTSYSEIDSLHFDYWRSNFLRELNHRMKM